MVAQPLVAKSSRVAERFARSLHVSLRMTGAAILKASRFIALLASFSAVMQACAPAQTRTADPRTDPRPEMSRRVQIGETRSALYALLRKMHFVAYNPVLAHFTSPGGHGYQAADGGEWPQPGQTPQPNNDPLLTPYFNAQRRNFNSKHPFAVVKYVWDVTDTCAKYGFQTFYFDANDRLERVVNSPFEQDCH